MKKRLIAVFLVAVSALALTSCGKNKAEIVTDDNIVKMEVGDTHKVELKSKNDDVVWVSRDDTVATVSADGVITAVAGGVTVITAKNDKSFAHIGVSVKGGQYVDKNGNIIEVFNGSSDITEITVGVKGGSKEDATFKVGEVRNLVAYTTPSDSKDKIVWRTANASVATVSETGEIKTVSKGKTEVTAYAPNGVKGKMIVRVK